MKKDAKENISDKKTTKVKKQIKNHPFTCVGITTKYPGPTA